MIENLKYVGIAAGLKTTSFTGELLSQERAAEIGRHAHAGDWLITSNHNMTAGVWTDKSKRQTFEKVGPENSYVREAFDRVVRPDEPMTATSIAMRESAGIDEIVKIALSEGRCVYSLNIHEDSGEIKSAVAGGFMFMDREELPPQTVEDFIDSQGLRYLEGRVIDLVAGHGPKSHTRGKQDVEQAIHYLREILRNDY